MSKDSLVVGVAGVFFGVLVGWIIGCQQAGARAPQAPPAAATSTSASSSTAAGGQQQAPPLDENRARRRSRRRAAESVGRATACRARQHVFRRRTVSRSGRLVPAGAQDPAEVRQCQHRSGDRVLLHERADKALAQFDTSLAIDPAHAKTLLNIGIVRAFGKQDLKGAAEVWQKVLVVAPASEEARAARQALDGIRSAHPELGIAKPAGILVIVGFIRLLFVYFIVRAVLRLLRGIAEGMQAPPAPKPPQAVPLVRDPVCGTYVVPSRARSAPERDRGCVSSALNSAAASYAMKIAQ